MYRLEEAFCLKVCGISEYFWGNHQFIHYSHVRRSILRDEKLNFVLVPMADIPLISDSLEDEVGDDLVAILNSFSFLSWSPLKMPAQTSERMLN